MNSPQLRVHLYVLTGNSVGEERLVDPEVTIGRLPECDLTLHDTGVSRKHARVLLQDDGVLLQDLGSSNGTKLGGQRVQSAVLEDGSVFSVGPVEMRVRIDEIVRAAPSPEPELSVRPRESATPSPSGPVDSSVRAAPREGGAHRQPSGILQYSAKRPRGPHADDLTQKSPLQRVLLVAVAVALAGLAGYLAFTAAR